MPPPLVDPMLAWPTAARVFALATVALLVAPAGAAAHARWRWPARGDVVGPFHFDPARRFARGQRRGIVVAAPAGERVRAACAGTVTFAGGVGRSGLVVSQSCGRLSATYLRLGTIATRRGRWLAAGDAIGAVAVGGRYGLGARVRSHDDAYLDPLSLLGRGPAAARRPGTRPPGAAPVSRRAPLQPAADPARRPPALPPGAPAPSSRLARRPAPVPIGLPLGIWWLPTGLALLGAAALLGVCGWLARRPRPSAQPRPLTRDAAGEGSNQAGFAGGRPIA